MSKILNPDAIQGRQKRALVSVSQERPDEYDPDKCNRAAYILTVSDVPALLDAVDTLASALAGLLRLDEAPTTGTEYEQAVAQAHAALATVTHATGGAA